MNTDAPSERVETLRLGIEQALLRHLPSDNTAQALAPQLLAAMRYSTSIGGKRIRPLLVLASCDALGGDVDRAMIPACALEYIHTYSLIHDDLPAMDDDVLRRGSPTCHVAFDEATAILAGNALLTHAIQLLVTCPDFAPQIRLDILACATRAAGCEGMLAGQCLDLASTGAELDEPRLEAMHNAKTGALIRASVRIGALCSGVSSREDLEHLDEFARHIGLAFQVTDDVLNETGSTAQLGKTAGSDAAQGKNTYPRLLTLAGAHAKARALADAAFDALAPFGERAALLRNLAQRLRDRDR